MAGESEHERTLREILEGKSPPTPRRKIRRIKPEDASTEAARQLAEGMLEARQKQRDAEDKKRIAAAIDWLREKWGVQECPYCGEIEWQVGTPLEVAIWPDEAMSPAFPVMCGNCGHTTFVNSIVAGISEPEVGEE